jgi:hypothetical protein
MTKVFVAGDLDDMSMATRGCVLVLPLIARRIDMDGRRPSRFFGS